MPRPWLGGDRYGSHPRASYGKVQRTGQDAARCEPGVRTRDSGETDGLGMTERLRAASIAALMSVAFSALLAGCAGSPPPDGKGPRSESMSADQFGQTDFNRTVTLEVRDNLASLYVLLDKLYRRNPANGARPTPPISPPPWRASSAHRAPPAARPVRPARHPDPGRLAGPQLLGRPRRRLHLRPGRHHHRRPQRQDPAVRVRRAGRPAGLQCRSERRGRRLAAGVAP